MRETSGTHPVSLRNGNVLMRADVNINRSEDFTYDAIDRLTQTRLFNSAIAGGTAASMETLYYDDFGNIKQAIGAGTTGPEPNRRPYHRIERDMRPSISGLNQTRRTTKS